ncbi:MAG: hypothetical protein AAF170_14665 [Bacteroidota bacterium]
MRPLNSRVARRRTIYDRMSGTCLGATAAIVVAAFTTTPWALGGLGVTLPLAWWFDNLDPETGLLAHIFGWIPELFKSETWTRP